MGDEAEALSDWGSDAEVNDLMREDELDATLGYYEAAKAAKVGSLIVCPTCQIRHTKTTYHKIFCSNAKTHGRKNCKDIYWNLVRGCSSHSYNKWQ
jgi:hypothetical protein